MINKNHTKICWSSPIIIRQPVYTEIHELLFARFCIIQVTHSTLIPSFLTMLYFFAFDKKLLVANMSTW